MKEGRRKSPGVLKLACAAAALLTLAPNAVLAQQVTTLIHFTNVWKFDQLGRELGTAWRTNNYNDAAWSSGPGLLGFDDTPGTPATYNLHAAINTPLIISSTVTTFYFRTTFNFAGSTNGLSLVATNLVDDGCVIYLNGLRAGAVRAPSTPGIVINANTFFTGPATEGQLDFVALTNLSALRLGQNLLAVEVHQSSNPNSDIMWGMRLMAFEPLPLAITSQPQGQTVAVGDSVTLTVGISGGPVTYRWQRDGMVLPSTSNSYSIASAQFNHAGDYRVTVSNAISVVTSTVARLTVLTDTTGPQLLAAIGNDTSGPGQGYGSNTIRVMFSELLDVSTGTNRTNYAVTRLGTTNRIPIVSIAYGFALGVLLRVDAADPDWVYQGDYVLTVNGVTDDAGNVVPPDSKVVVSWIYSKELLSATAPWEFHASAVFDPEVFGEAWTAPDFSPSFWWAHGQGVFYGGPASGGTCFGGFQTPTGYQPEPVLFRTTFQWPAEWPSTGTLQPAVAFDDGLVLYLNGREIHRTNVAPAVPVSATTRALVSTTTGACYTNSPITVTDLLPGTNWLAAAVVQPVTGAEGDLVFGLRLSGSVLLAPPLPQSPEPTLNISLRGDSVRLSWIGSGYALESTTNLSVGPASYPSGPWQQVPNMSNPYTNRLDDVRRFFRLKR